MGKMWFGYDSCTVSIETVQNYIPSRMCCKILNILIIIMIYGKVPSHNLLHLTIYLNQILIVIF